MAVNQQPTNIRRFEMVPPSSDVHRPGWRRLAIARLKPEAPDFKLTKNELSVVSSEQRESGTAANPTRVSTLWTRSSGELPFELEVWRSVLSSWPGSWLGFREAAYFVAGS